MELTGSGFNYVDLMQKRGLIVRLFNKKRVLLINEFMPSYIK